jgi:multidrug resistance efflux pump
MKESLLGADFFAKTVDNRDFTIDYLPKAQARKLYAIANEYKENARQEPQASAPKIESTPAPEVIAPPVMEEQDKVAETLQKLKKLYESGLITQQEFENKKNEIINSL